MLLTITENALHLLDNTSLYIVQKERDGIKFESINLTSKKVNSSSSHQTSHMSMPQTMQTHGLFIGFISLEKMHPILVITIGNLALDLLGRAEQVRVVLAEVAAALDALQRAGGLIAEVVGDLADADGQLTVAVRLVGVEIGRAHV